MVQELEAVQTELLSLHKEQFQVTVFVHKWSRNLKLYRRKCAVWYMYKLYMGSISLQLYSVHMEILVLNSQKQGTLIVRVKGNKDVDCVHCTAA